MNEGPFVNELIHYAILEKTALSIDAESLAKFGITLSIRGNVVFWTNPQDPIAKSLFKQDIGRQNLDPTPSLLKGVEQDPNQQHPKLGDFWSKVKYLGSLAWQHRDAIANVASSVLPLLMADKPPDEALHNLVPVANYTCTLQRLYRCLDDQFFASDPLFSSLATRLRAKLEARLLHLRHNQGRLFEIPMNIEPPEEE